jgi:hypothetical protein
LQQSRERSQGFRTALHWPFAASLLLPRNAAKPPPTTAPRAARREVLTDTFRIKRSN